MAEAKSELEQERDRCLFWEKTAKRSQESSDYYQEQLTAAHAIIGRLVHQASDMDGRVNVSKYFPTDNRHSKRSFDNPSGKKAE